MLRVCNRNPILALFEILLVLMICFIVAVISRFSCYILIMISIVLFTRAFLGFEILGNLPISYNSSPEPTFKGSKRQIKQGSFARSFTSSAGCVLCQSVDSVGVS